MNKVILMGRLTRDPELRYGQNTQAVCRYSLAVNRSYRREGSQQPEADFFNCVAFAGRAEFASKWFRKGMQVAVVGELRNSNYEKDGVRHYSTEIIVSEQFFAEGRQSSGERSASGDFAPMSSGNYGNNYQGSSAPAPSQSYSPEGFTPVETITEDQDLPF